MRNLDIEKCILYENKDFMVVKKPAGLPVQCARVGTMDLEKALKNYLAVKKPEHAHILRVVHRLDQPVEGVIVFAKTKFAASELSRQITTGEMGKYYYAVTDRVGKEKNGVLEDTLLKELGQNVSRVVEKGTPEGKVARLSYEILEEIEDPKTDTGKKYLVRIKLDTGRHHQIRVQMSHAGMPLIGDRKYNPEEKSGYPLALCSYSLELVPPKKKTKMSYQIVPEGEAFAGFTCLAQ